jgi:hypothetical protein
MDMPLGQGCQGLEALGSMGSTGSAEGSLGAGPGRRMPWSPSNRDEVGAQPNRARVGLHEMAMGVLGGAWRLP